MSAQSGTVNGSDAVEGDDLGNLSCFSSRLYSLSWVRVGGVGGVVGGKTTQKQ